LHSDPLFKVLAGRSPYGASLVSQPTFSRFEYAIDIPSLDRPRYVFIDPFIRSFLEPARYLGFDPDMCDDRTYGEQPLTFSHNLYVKCTYTNSDVLCTDSNVVVMVSWLLAPPLLCWVSIVI